MPTLSSVRNYHGILSFTTNALGFARVAWVPSQGILLVYNAATHTDTVIAASTTLLSLASDISTWSMFKQVSAGFTCRSIQSLTTETGTIASYQAPTLYSKDTYDIYRDFPDHYVFGRGEVAKVNYIPYDPNELTFDYLSVGTYHCLGFMIRGAASQTYELEYSVNYEYILITPSGDSFPVEKGPSHPHSIHIPKMNTADPKDVQKGLLTRLADYGIDRFKDELRKVGEDYFYGQPEQYLKEVM